MAQLDGTGQRVELAPGYRLSAPGLVGTAEARPGWAPGTRAGGQATPAIDQALVATDVNQLQLVELDVQRALGPPGGGGGRADATPTGVVLEVPDLGETVGQLVLAIDDQGVATWHLPQDAQGALEPPTTRGAGGTKRFVIDRQVSVTPEDGQRRGPLGVVGRILLKVLVYPVTDAVLGPVGEHFAGRWEQRKRPYGVRRFGPDDYAGAAAPGLTGDDWRGLAGGRALLFLHGTFSTAASGFGGLPAPTMAALHRAYGGRTFAFDHYTLSEDPEQNVRWLAARVPSGLDLEVDLVCHSRGGLVARALAAARLQGLRVNRVVFVGTPNSGTALADADHMTELIDRFTSVLNLAPPGPLEMVAEILEGVVTAVKVIGHAAINGLPGLYAMAPGRDYLRRLDAASSVGGAHYGIGADFEPEAGLRNLVRKATDVLLDRVFDDQPNDLIVPTAGVFEGADGSRIPEQRVLRIESSFAISHCRYFSHPRTSEKLIEWLAAS